MISAPAPTTVRGATVTPSRTVELTPKKHRSPTVTFPETTTCEARKQWSPIVVWWPMWLPLHSTTLLPMRTNGWIVFSSKTKQLSPSSTPLHTVARELTYVINSYPSDLHCSYTRLRPSLTWLYPTATKSDTRV